MTRYKDVTGTDKNAESSLMFTYRRRFSWGDPTELAEDLTAKQEDLADASLGTRDFLHTNMP